MPDALVKNAADEGQVQQAGKQERFKRRQELDDLRAVLALEPGQRLLWRLLEHCKVFESIWHPSALIHHNAGRQDVGHFLLGEITEAHSESLVKMMQDNQKEHGDG